MKNTDILVPYTPEWSQKFVKERRELLKEIEEENIRIEHIGSTSVEGMEARPIIDMMIGLGDFDKSIKKVKRVLKGNGYREMANLLELNERCLFIKEDDNGIRIFSALIVKINSRLWRKKLERKRVLASSESARTDYINFKKKSIEKSKGDLEEYFRMKEEYFSKKWGRRWII